MSEIGEPYGAAGNQRTGWAQLATGETVELAPPSRRLGARILDGVIVVVVILVLAAVAFGGLVASDAGEGIAAGAFLGLSLIGLVFGIAYEVAPTAIWGQTLGKRMTGIKVINAAHGGSPGAGKAIGRWAIPSLVALIPFIGWLLSLLCYVSLTWDRVFQGWHDKAAGTLVIKA